MSITNLDGYIASSKQILLQKKTASITAVAQMITSPFAAAGIPGAGVLAGTDTATGIIQTDAIAGYPPINAFGGGATGYITRLNGYCSVPGALYLSDVLWKGGAYVYNAGVAVSSPSWSSRVPGGTDFNGLEIWIEAVTAFTGNQSIRVQYTDQDGNAGDTGVIATAVAPIIGRCLKLPLASGDSGVRSITNVISSVSTVGTFNVLVVRPLAQMRIPVGGYSEQRDLYGTGMPIIFDNSALAVHFRPDSTASGLPEWEIEICNG